MSFVDLATLTMHRRHELQSRTHVFHEKCDRAINDIKNFKMKASGFVTELNCDPSELKDRFLNLMQKLDEYIYLITDFNLALAQTADADSSENTPVQDAPCLPPSLSPFNLMDALTEPHLASSHACPNLCPPEKPVRARTPKEQQRLIVFSSSSSAESVPTRSEKEIQCQMTEDMDNLSIAVPTQAVSPSAPVAEYNHKECCITAAQPVLEVDHEYPATILSVDRYSFWVITEDPMNVASFMSEMTDYYMSNQREISAAELEEMTYCAYFDEGCFYRAMFLQKPEGELKTVSVYVVDTGEVREASIERVQPLVKQFCDRPPYARLCHLAGLDFGEKLYNKTCKQKQFAFLRKYNGSHCTILVDDNSSESLGVYVKLPSTNTSLNELMVEHGLAIPIDKPFQAMHKGTAAGAQHSSASHGPPPETSEDEWSLANLDITQCPEYEDPVVAVTGYHNRDEADICKHYKGGPEKTCFKGARCTKKHILHHPGVQMDRLSGSGKNIEINACDYRSITNNRTDGWTMDQVEVVAKCKSIPLPAPGTWLTVLVTAVCHYDRVFVQIVQDTEEDDVPEFGVVLPPMTLATLQRDMNSPATIQAYKPLTIAPALGEIVAALYPPDNCWYRAKVLTVTRLDQSVEIMYVDYGTVLWVKEDLIRQLEARFALLPLQAVQCALAGVRSPPHANSAHWARAKRILAHLTQERPLQAHVIAREYDEVIVELFINDDPDDPTREQNVAELLAQRGLVELTDYTVTNDDVAQKLVVP